MTIKDRIRVFFHKFLIWHKNWTYSVDNTDVGFKCDCGKEIGDVSWAKIFESLDR